MQISYSFKFLAYSGSIELHSTDSEIFWIRRLTDW
jgi:hypothetical protein